MLCILKFVSRLCLLFKWERACSNIFHNSYVQIKHTLTLNIIQDWSPFFMASELFSLKFDLSFQFGKLWLDWDLNMTCYRAYLIWHWLSNFLLGKGRKRHNKVVYTLSEKKRGQNYTESLNQIFLSMWHFWCLHFMHFREEIEKKITVFLSISFTV